MSLNVDKLSRLTSPPKQQFNQRSHKLTLEQYFDLSIRLFCSATKDSIHIVQDRATKRTFQSRSDKATYVHFERSKSND